MWYLTPMFTQHKPTILHESTRVMLRRLIADDQAEFVELVNESADLLLPWVHLPGSAAKFEEYLNQFDGETRECTLVCDRKTGAIAGTFSLKNITRSPYQRATVGYNAFAFSAGQGYMSEGFELVFRLAFGDLGLHRLEADIQPGNELSLRLASKVGFRREGYSPEFLYVDGSWKDHERWAITSDMVSMLW